MPPLASVAYASAISSGLTTDVPSVMDGTSSSLLVMPILCATAAVFDGPTSTESWAKTTLSEMVVACATVSGPPLPSPFTIHGAGVPPIGMTIGLLDE